MARVTVAQSKAQGVSITLDPKTRFATITGNLDEIREALQGFREGGEKFGTAGNGGPVGQTTGQNPVKTRRPMSAARRKQLSEMMKARYAKTAPKGAKTKAAAA